MAENVRVRYAPSPTGEPHIGNVRTALFNWLFARHHGGKFIVRVEDTDQERLVPGATDAILDSLQWLSIEWDEGPRVGGPYAPYIQSERLGIYQELAENLVRQGRAYRCYCSRELLAQMRQERREHGFATGFQCPCRKMTQQERREAESKEGTPVIRFGMPESGVTVVHDLVRGDVEWQNELLEDFIILKSDGFPTYHLAVVADDHLMEISHVLRAEEWLPSTPRHLQLYDALGFPPPQFGHLPMILGPDRAKLSKRHGAAAVFEYRDGGYLPEALLNFMVLLGWSLDDKTEVMPLDTIIQSFDLERVTKSAAIFDREKLEWMSGIYLRQLSAGELAERMLPFLERDLAADEQDIERADSLEALRPRKYLNLGIAHRGKYEHEEAIEAYKKALEYDPELFEAYLFLADTYEFTGRLADAMTIYRAEARRYEAADSLERRIYSLIPIPSPILGKRRAVV